MSEIKQPTIVFPYMFGPAVRRFATAILWNDRLIVSGGSFISSNAVACFNALAPASVGTVLEPVFRTAGHHASLAAQQFAAERRTLADLKSRLKVVAFVGPGNLKSYDDWVPFHKSCLQIAATGLNDVQVLNAACNAFVWRVFDTSLDLGGELERPLKNSALLMKYFMDRAQQLGGVEYLLAETLLHQHGSFKSVGGLVTDSLPTLAVFEEIGKTISTPETEVPRSSVELPLAFQIFDALFQNHVSLIDQKEVHKVAALLDERKEELSRAKDACVKTAATLLSANRSDAQLKVALAATLEGFEEEIGSLLNIDQTARKNLLKRVTEDEKM